jgi:hypothetical protein
LQLPLQQSEPFRQADPLATQQTAPAQLPTQHWPLAVQGCPTVVQQDPPRHESAELAQLLVQDGPQ